MIVKIEKMMINNRNTGLKLATLAYWLLAFHTSVGEGSNVCNTIDYTPYDDLQRAFGNCSGECNCKYMLQCNSEYNKCTDIRLNCKCKCRKWRLYFSEM